MNIKRNKQGKFRSARLSVKVAELKRRIIYQVKRACLILGGAAMLGIIGGILIHYSVALHLPQPETAQAATTTIAMPEPKPEPQVVQIRVVTNWTPERIAEEIDRVFPDAPIMHRVMACESGGDIEAYNPTNNSHDNGLFQVSDYYHGKRVRALGLDIGDPADNIKFARILYDESGLQPWSASKPCWSGK